MLQKKQIYKKEKKKAEIKCPVLKTSNFQLHWVWADIIQFPEKS